MEKMNKHIGIKEVLAIPMTRGEFAAHMSLELAAVADPDDPGFLVEYVGDGNSNHPDHKNRVSWLAKPAFETAYSRVEYEKSEFDSMAIPELAKVLKEIKDVLDRAGDVKTEIQKLCDWISIGILPERMDEEGVETLKIKDVGRLQVKADINCSIPAANRDSVQSWLREHGHGSLVSETVNASTFKAFVKEAMKEGKEYPEQLITVSAYSRATVVKA